jgi:hypothetical protein
MSWNRLLCSAVILVSISGQLPAADSADGTAETYELRYRFTEGQELHYRITDEKRYDIHVADQSDTVRHSSNTLRKHDVQAIGDDGNARIELTLVHAQMSAESGEDTVTYDSTVDAIPPAVFQGVAGTIGHPLGIVTVSPRGEVVDTELLIEGRNASEFESAQHDLLPLLPESPVAVGDIWRDPFEVEIPVDAEQQQKQPEQQLKKRIKLERVYSLELVEDGQATIAVRTVVLSPVRDAFQQGELMLRTSHGTVRLDLERGLLVDRSLTLENTVVGFQGPQSSLTVAGTHQDALVSPDDVAADESDRSASR